MLNDETQEANLDETQTDESEEDESTEEETTEETSPDYEAQVKEKDDEIKKLKAILERNKKKTVTKTNSKSEDTDDLKSDIEFLKTSEKKRTFGYEHGLSPEETDKIFSINPSPTEETLKDPFVKAGLEAIRKAKRLEENTPSSNQKASPVNTKKFKEMSPEDQNKAWQEHLRSKGVKV